jgi:hypothetical protein
MAQRSHWVGTFLFLVAAFGACSFDGRTLQVSSGPTGGDTNSAGDASQGGTTNPGGAANRGGTSSSAGKVGTGGMTSSSGSGGSSSPEGGAGPLGAGEKCSADEDCGTGPCLDGVCCAKACDGICLSCASALTGQGDGACEKVQAGMDPHDDCALGKDVCGQDGQCDGAGACRFASSSTTCGAEACGNDQYTPAAQCDGAGACAPPKATSCSGHPCVGTRCDIPCKLPADCGAGLYCDGTRCAPQKADGSSCAASAECTNAHCTGEKICCDKPCDTTCNSCLQASTGQTSGKCAAVQSGKKHGNDCPGAAKCNGTTAVTPAPACNGAGACAAPPDVQCGNYDCNAATTSCLTTCNTSVDCASTAYCAAKACKPRNVPGTVCTADDQCDSAKCGGRCCKAGTPCTCPQPSAGNLIKNPGFDKDLSSWTVDPGAATIIWQAGTTKRSNGGYADSNACAYSGSAYISEPDTSNSQQLWQCVPISTDTSYDFGSQQATLGGAYSHCSIDLYQGPACTGSVSPTADNLWLNVDWSLGGITKTFDSSFYTSAKVYCYIEGGGAFYIDDIYLTPDPGMY